MKQLSILLFLLAAIQVQADAPDVNQFGEGFSSLRWIFDPKSFASYGENVGNHLWKGDVEVNFDKVTQVVFIYNQWHLAAILPNLEDGRLKCLKRDVFKMTLHFSNAWPIQRDPGYVAVFKTANNEWILVADMEKYYLIEGPNGIGTVSKLNREEPTKENP